MYLLFVGFLVVGLCEGHALDPINNGVGGSRQKRLLFYDEEGNLVKTYKNPYLYDFTKTADKIPFLGNIFNPFFNFLRPTTYGVPTAYMIPVSDQVIQQVNSDPMYQNKLQTLPRKEILVEPNPQCAGKRTQIPSKSCRNFLNCWDGWAFEQECPEGLLFAKEGYCDYPQNVDCSQRTAEPLPPPQCSTEFEAIRNEEQCDEFFICVDRVLVRFKCPADLVYNKELGVCDYQYRVDCNSSSTPATPKPSSEEPAAPSKPCSHKSDDAPLTAPPSFLAPGSESAVVQQPPMDMNSLTHNSIVNTQSWSSTHVAISRQDAIRQLQIGSNPNNNA